MSSTSGSATYGTESTIVDFSNCSVTWNLNSKTNPYSRTIFGVSCYAYKLGSANTKNYITISPADDESFKEGDVVIAYLASSNANKSVGLKIGSTSGTEFSETASSTAELVTAAYSLTSSDISSDGSLTFYGNGTYCYVAGIAVYRSIDQTIVSSGYNTFSAPCATTIPEGITAYQATTVSDNTVTLTALSGSIIPANTGVVIKGTANQSYTFTATATAATDDFTSNLLIAATDDDAYNITFTSNETATDTKYYALNEGVWKVIANSVRSITANKAILPVIVTTTSGVALDTSFSDELSTGSSSETTGIGNVTSKTQPSDGVYYNLQGMRVANPISGMYIVNGKKVIIK